jgi:hypothetical protein
MLHTLPEHTHSFCAMTGLAAVLQVPRTCARPLMLRWCAVSAKSPAYVRGRTTCKQHSSSSSTHQTNFVCQVDKCVVSTLST